MSTSNDHDAQTSRDDAKNLGDSIPGAKSADDLIVDDVLAPGELESFARMDDLGDSLDEKAPESSSGGRSDFLDTLEMPVFKLPHSLDEPASSPNTIPDPPKSNSATPKRPKPQNTWSDTPSPTPHSTLPDLVQKQAPLTRGKWKEGLPQGASQLKEALDSEDEADSIEDFLEPPTPPHGITTTPRPIPPQVPPVPASGSMPAIPKPPPVRKPTPPRLPATSAPPPQKDDEIDGLVRELLNEDKPAAPQKLAPPKTPAWYESIFNEEYFRTLPLGFHKQTRREAQFISDCLGVGGGGRILDLGCGFGRHTLELAKRGYDMMGLDLSLPLLQKALNEAQKRKLSIRFVHGDIRDLNFNGIFDACFSFHTSFGYFDDKTNFEVLRGIHRALKPNGRFLVEMINRDFVVSLLPRRKWWEGADCIFLEEISFDYKKSVLHTKRSFIYEDGRPPWEQNIRIRLYSLHEMHNLLQHAGFQIKEVSGDMASRGAFFGPDSRHLIIMADKEG